ncbi:MAG: nicotinate-nucleotide adenylyltransferase [Lachnospiraceae bacterium]
MADIGIMGGTFDPIHNGHLRLGEQAYEEFQLDAVWFMPTGQPPHKKGRQITSAADRCAMVRLAIAGTPYFECSEFEVQRQGNSYTAETLALLHDKYPQHQFYFIIGADSLYEIETWYQPARVMAQTILLAAGREYHPAVRSMDDQIAYLTKHYQARIYRLHCDEVDISSEELRQMAASGRKLFEYLPKNVEDYIHTHDLYQT